MVMGGCVKGQRKRNPIGSVPPDPPPPPAPRVLNAFGAPVREPQKQLRPYNGFRDDYLPLFVFLVIAYGLGLISGFTLGWAW